MSLALKKDIHSTKVAVNEVKHKTWLHPPIDSLSSFSSGRRNCTMKGRKGKSIVMAKALASYGGGREEEEGGEERREGEGREKREEERGEEKKEG